ncbi:MAG: DUF501 domain-containing protein [Thermoleophilia bacterium]
MENAGTRGERGWDPDATALLAAQLGRPPRGRWRVVTNCPFDFPAVIETAPYLDDGTPFPTLFYLTCPSAVERITKLEASGGVEAFRQTVAADPESAAALDALDDLYRRRRHELAEVIGIDGGRVLERGIGGPDGPLRASCLHAYAAALLAATESGAPDAGAPDPPPVWRSLLFDMGPLWCDDARCARLTDSEAVRRAAIDVGTNSVRLLVAVVGGDRRVQTLVRRAEITQLGAGLRPGGRFDPDARRRTAAAVARFAEEARGLGVDRIRLVATSAARDAEDGREFVESLGEQSQVDARVASGSEEAVLSYVGATLDLDSDAVVLDIGGGSTEAVRAADSARLAGDEEGRFPLPKVDAVSFNIGCVRGTEEWFTADPPPSAERATARRAAREAFASLAERFGASAGLLVGVAGTITTLACLAFGLESYDSDSIHLSVFTRKEMEAQVNALAALDPEVRAALPCMQEGRARVIVAGGEIVLGAMEALGWEKITVSERDMLDGIVLEE